MKFIYKMWLVPTAAMSGMNYGNVLALKQT